MKIHTLNLISVKRIRDALDTIMIASPEKVLRTLVKYYNETEIGYIMSNMEEALDFLDEEVAKKNRGDS
jgi:hypothetical protein